MISLTMSITFLIFLDFGQKNEKIAVLFGIWHIDKVDGLI
jgi:hypothetical protein